MHWKSILRLFLRGLANNFLVLGVMLYNYEVIIIISDKQCTKQAPLCGNLEIPRPWCHTIGKMELEKHLGEMFASHEHSYQNFQMCFLCITETSFALFLFYFIHKAFSKILIAWLSVLILVLFFLCGIKSKSDLILKGFKECWIWHQERKIVSLQWEWYGNQILQMLPKRRKMSSWCWWLAT